ncbi:hypothetical protein LC55x_0644 [Lysobacter capsici]|nr:hypothetical protein LC55x_0644 [Lysobacter capsici]
MPVCILGFQHRPDFLSIRYGRKGDAMDAMQHARGGRRRRDDVSPVAPLRFPPLVLLADRA